MVWPGIVMVCGGLLGGVEDKFVKCPKCKNRGTDALEDEKDMGKGPRFRWKMYPDNDPQHIHPHKRECCFYKCNICSHIWNRSYATVENDDGDDCDE